MVTRVGIFGGSFDPIHHGHLCLAMNAYDYLKLSKILFVPVYKQPFKEFPVASPAERLDMLRRALERYPGFKVDMRELERRGGSYTADTLKSFDTLQNHFLLVGSDSLTSISKWKDWEYISQNIHIFAYYRRDGVSSSLVREHLAKGTDLSAWVPQPVLKYIHERGLYGWPHADPKRKKG